MVVNFTALQLKKAVNSHLTVSYNISLYRDTQVAIYRYTQIVYRCISSTYVHMYVCMYVCMYVRTYVCTYVCMYVCTYCGVLVIQCDGCLCSFS